MDLRDRRFVLELSALAALILAPGAASAEDCHGTKDAEERWQGVVTCNWPWGKVETVAQYRDGKLHGTKKSYGGAKGALAGEERFRDGTLHGPSRFWSEEHGTLNDEKPYRDGSLHGVHRVWQDEGRGGRLETETTYEGGKKSGPARRFHSNGKLSELVTYANDEQDGPMEKYWDTGLPEESCGFKVGKRHGEHKRYYVNGKPMYASTYVAGNQHGLFRHFHDNGTELEVKCWQDDKEVVGLGPCVGKGGQPETLVTRYGNGKVQLEVRVSGGKRNGPLKAYWEDGKTLEESTYKDDALEGPSRKFARGGKLEWEATYRAGKLVGVERHFHENGKPRLEQDWKGDLVVAERAFHMNGQRKSEKTLSAEGAGTIREYDDAGRLREEAPYRTADRGSSWSSWRHEAYHGTVRRFHENGKPSEEASYVDGRRDGPTKEFWDDGKLAGKATYKAGSLVSRTTYDPSGRVLSTEELNADGSRK